MLMKKLREDLKSAMKEKDNEKKIVLQLLIASFTKFEKENKRILSQDEEISLVNKELKQLNESLEFAIKANREDLINETNKKINFIKSYLPEQISEDKALDIIQESLINLNIENPTKKDIGKIMKEVRPRLNGKINGDVINKLIMSLLK